jgi:hypothetical protein
MFRTISRQLIEGAETVERGGLEMRSALSLKIPLHPEM